MNPRKADGFALIDLLFVTGIIGILTSIAMPNLLLAKQAAGASSAIGSLRAINSAEFTYAFTCGSGFYAPNLTTLGTPPPGSNEPFISPNLGIADSVNVAGYLIKVEADSYAPAPPTCNGLAAGEAGRGFRSGANPIVIPQQLPRFFAVNTGGEIWEDTDDLFAVMPEAGEPPSGHPVQ